MTSILDAGGVYTMEMDSVYPLPVKTVRVAFYSESGSLEWSYDGVDWFSVTLDINNEANLSAKFVRVIDDSAVISVKNIKKAY